MAIRKYFLVGRDNVIAAASPPSYFVTRSSSGETNSHNNLTEDTQERHDHKNEKKTPNILAGLFSQRFDDKPLILTKQNPGPHSARDR
jgi:hypothetical protein